MNVILPFGVEKGKKYFEKRELNFLPVAFVRLPRSDLMVSNAFRNSNSRTREKVNQLLEGVAGKRKW